MFQRQPWMQRAGEHPPGDKDYFALLARAVFSAGLGPKVVESRWEGLRAGFADFDPQVLASWGAEEVERLLADRSVIRNRRKIEAVLANASVCLEVVQQHGSFAVFIESCGVAEDFEAAARLLTERFAHLGPASAAFFLFSCGWRQKSGEFGPAEVERSALENGEAQVTEESVTAESRATDEPRATAASQETAETQAAPARPSGRGRREKAQTAVAGTRA
jgi:hypothetical protein